MTNPPRAHERTSPSTGASADSIKEVVIGPNTLADPKSANLPAKRPNPSGELITMSWYERMGHAAIFPGGDDDVERVDT